MDFSAYIFILPSFSKSSCFTIIRYCRNQKEEVQRQISGLKGCVCVCARIKPFQEQQKTNGKLLQSLCEEQSAKWKRLQHSREKETTTHSSILAWKIPWTEEPGGLQSMGLQRVRHDLASEQEQGAHMVWFSLVMLGSCCSQSPKSARYSWG